MKHFLIFDLQPVCYDSYSYFASAFADALTKAGHIVEIFSAAEEPPEAMERFAGKTFDAVIDFNSGLPRLKMDDNSSFLNHIRAPFYDIILDHPLYHHDSLKQKISGFHVLCLDENHKQYLKNYYPHIVSADVFPVMGEDAAPMDAAYPSKTIEVLFSGTYTDPREVWDSIQTCPSFIGEIIDKLAGMMQEDCSLAQEDALLRLLPSLEEAEIIKETFPLHMQACFLCDSYLRAFRREKLLLHLAEEKVPLTLCGNGWRKSPLADFPHIRIIDDISFRDTFFLFRQSKITLNLLPEFKNGTHDRIYSSMLNHSLCLTDSSPLLEKQFRNGRELVFYNVQNPESLTAHIFDLLSSPKRIAEISQNGYSAAKKQHTWQEMAAYFLSMLP